MKDTKIIMGMPITIEVGQPCKQQDLEQVFDYFRTVDQRYSPYKATSELSQHNNGRPLVERSSEFRHILRLCELTRQQTGGYFDICQADGTLDTSGLVKGWAIQNAANLLHLYGYNEFSIEAGGDIQVSKPVANQQPWTIGIRNPFDITQIVKTLKIYCEGVATSGTYIRGQHIYDPLNDYAHPQSVVSLTVVGPLVFHADRLATAAFAMGVQGINFIEGIPGYEGYMIDANQMATFTTGFERYVA